MNNKNTTKTYQRGIYVESKPVNNTNNFKYLLKALNFDKYINSDHLLLVYKDENGQERIIRGGPKDEGDLKSVFTNIVPIEVQKNLPRNQSYDKYEKDTGPKTRHQKRLDIPVGKEAETWQKFNTTAGVINDAGFIYKNPANMKNIQNSNTTIRTILQQNGYNPQQALPETQVYVPGYDTHLPDHPEFTARVNIDDPKMPQLMDKTEQEARLEQLKRQDVARKKILEAFKKSDNPNYEILLKQDKDITEDEVRKASGYARFEEKDPQQRDSLNSKISGWYNSMFGIEPVKQDAAGRNLEPQAKMPMAAEPRRLKTKDGMDIEAGLENLSSSLAEREDAVKAMQRGINQLGYQPALKEDGVLGPKTAFGIKSSLVKHGVNELRKRLV